MATVTLPTHAVNTLGAIAVVLPIIVAVLGCLASGVHLDVSLVARAFSNAGARTTTVGFIFNGPRLLAVTGTLILGKVIVKFGGYENACMIIATIYILALSGPTVA